MRPDDLTAYLDGELPPEEEDRVERELERDPALRDMLAELCRQRLLLAEAFREPAARPFPAAVRSRASRRTPRAEPGAAFFRIFCGGLAAGAAIVLVASLLFRRTPERPATARQEPPETTHRPVEEAPKEPPHVPQEVKPPETAPRIADVPPPSKPEAIPVPAPPPVVTDVRPPTDKPAPQPPREIVGVLRLDELQGESWIASPSGKAAARPGDWLGIGQTLEAGGRVAARYPDGTRLEIGPGSSLELKEGAGKRLHLERGEISADVPRQPADTPMVISTPQAEATIIGTALRISANADQTRLEVLEGKVRLKRRSDGRTVDVSGGHYAVAAPGTPLVTKPLEPTEPIAMEIEEFGTGRLLKQADGPVRRPFLEPLRGASGGRCAAAPGLGAEISGMLTLPRGLWHLWIRYRDENEGKTSFDVLINGKLLGSVTGTGKSKEWLWKRFSFQAEGKIILSLRATAEAVRQSDPNRDPERKNPYSVVTRWDRIVITRDTAYSPDK